MKASPLLALALSRGFLVAVVLWGYSRHLARTRGTHARMWLSVR